MSKIKVIFNTIYFAADYINRHELYGYFVFSAVIIALLLSVGACYAVKELENDISKYKTATESYIQKLDSVSHTIDIMDAKVDILVNFVERN